MMMHTTESDRRVIDLSRLLVAAELVMEPAELIAAMRSRVPGSTELEVLAALHSLHALVSDRIAAVERHIIGPLN